MGDIGDAVTPAPPLPPRRPPTPMPPPPPTPPTPPPLLPSPCRRRWLNKSVGSLRIATASLYTRKACAACGVGAAERGPLGSTPHCSPGLTCSHVQGSSVGFWRVLARVRDPA
eukprot:361893-Chlamydomonas_euryale.AAC.1